MRNEFRQVERLRGMKCFPATVVGAPLSKRSSCRQQTSPPVLLPAGPVSVFVASSDPAAPLTRAYASFKGWRNFVPYVSQLIFVAVL